MLVLGLDPGGAKAFGWAIVTGTFNAPKFVTGGVCSGARSAISEVEKNLAGEVAAVGIDAPLFWSSAGDRRADAHVRKLVCVCGGHAGTVSHVNSLQGACLVEGSVAALLVHERWPNAQLTEAHPKALLRVCAEAAEFAASPEVQGNGHHLRDAALGALAALAMLERRAAWADLAALETEPLYPLGVHVAYWFPQQPNPSFKRTPNGAA